MGGLGNKTKTLLKTDDCDKIIEIAVLICAFCCYVHFYLSRAAIVIASSLFLLNPNVRRKIIAYKSFWLMLAIGVSGFTVSVVRLSFLGGAIGLSFIFSMIMAYAVLSVVNKLFYERVFDVIIVGGCFATVVSIIEKIINRNVQGYRCQGFFNNPNLLGFACALVIFICAYKAVNCKGKVYVYYLAAVFNTIGIVLCGSMSVFPMIGLFIILFLAFCRKYKLLLIFAGVLVLAAVILISFPQLLSRFHELKATIDNRIQIWEFSIERIKDSPVFGYGFYGYKHISGIYGAFDSSVYQTSHCHNVILDVVLCHGIVGTGLIIVFSYCCIKKIARCVTANVMNCENRTIINFIIAVLIAVFVHSMIDISFFWAQTGPIILLICSGVSIAEKIERN